MFKVGDKVSVLDDDIKGVVSEVNGNTIQIKDYDGMLFFFDKSELIKIDNKQDELLRYSSMNNRFLNQKKEQKVIKKNIFKTVKKEKFIEVDLHAEKLVKSVKGMDNYDILNIQINTAKHKLEFAIKKGISRIIFIHGVGEGVLKKELHYLLNNYPVKYTDGSYKNYGLGATEVYVYQNA